MVPLKLEYNSLQNEDKPFCKELFEKEPISEKDEPLMIADYHSSSSKSSEFFEIIKEERIILSSSESVEILED